MTMTNATMVISTIINTTTIKVITTTTTTKIIPHFKAMTTKRKTRAT